MSPIFAWDAGIRLPRKAQGQPPRHAYGLGHNPCQPCRASPAVQAVPASAVGVWAAFAGVRAGYHGWYRPA